jgi:CrcB protein
MSALAWVCLAGAAGSGARYVIATWAAERLGSTFPYGTLIVNASGCFAITAVMHTALTLGWPPALRIAMTAGFLGGLTTYSTFNYETMRLLEAGAMSAAAVNALLTGLGGLAAGWLGLVAARQLLGS